jgi:hypothetical protein
VTGLSEVNDLVSCLARELKEASADQTNPEVIVFPSDVVAFQLLRLNSSDRQKFHFPAYFYLDQFLHEKFDYANEKRRLQQGLWDEITKLEMRRKTLTRFQVGNSQVHTNQL